MNFTIKMTKIKYNIKIINFLLKKCKLNFLLYNKNCKHNFYFKNRDDPCYILGNNEDNNDNKINKN